MRPSQLKRFLVQTIKEKKPVLIKGAPGIGKTDIVSQAAIEAGAELYFEFPAISDPTDSKGVPFTNGNDFAKWLQFERHYIYCNTKKLIVVFLDDLGQAPPVVQASFMQWILARRIGDNKVSDNVCFVAATNRRIDRANVSGMLEPVKSRFATIVELEVDLEDWIHWAINNMPVELISFIRYRPDLLHNFKPTNDLVNSPCPRTNANVGQLMKMKLDADLRYEAYAGAAGEGYAAELIGFLKIYHKLPNPDDILKDSKNHPVPTDPAELYALCGLLSRKANKKNFDAMVVYLNRMPEEFSICTVRDIVAIEKDSDIETTEGWKSWTKKHQDIVL